mmetsp:Transcript_137662/g.383982  ORF Transcript_137662/g.383982 Transcript_137662/m.383982 type:complete len:226 (-) Transcript_137662:456-1133(-)
MFQVFNLETASSSEDAESRGPLAILKGAANGQSVVLYTCRNCHMNFSHEVFIIAERREKTKRHQVHGATGQGPIDSRTGSIHHSLGQRSELCTKLAVPLFFLRWQTRHRRVVRQVRPHGVTIDRCERWGRCRHPGSGPQGHGCVQGYLIIHLLQLRVHLCLVVWILQRLLHQLVCEMSLGHLCLHLVHGLLHLLDVHNLVGLFHHGRGNLDGTRRRHRRDLGREV